jgi:hypothetical protein
MADLQAMFQNIGPTSASLMNGIQMGQQYNANESEQAMRQAQMDKVLQDTKQAELMNPLLVQGKQQELKAAQLKAQADEHAYHTQVLGDIIPQLEKVPNGPGQRLAYLQDYASKRGVPLNETELQQFAQDPDLVKSLKAMHNWGITENEKYRQAIDTANIQSKSHTQGINAQISAQKDLEQMRIDAGKYNKNKVATDVNSALLKPISSAQKAEILESAYYAAEAANDMVMANQYKQRAQQARARAAEDARNRAAGAPGTMGYADEQGNIDIQNKPAPAANAPIAGGPALGTAANPIVLK